MSSDLPDGWELTPELAGSEIRGKAYRSERYPVLVIEVRDRRPNFEVRLRFMTGDDDETISSETIEHYMDATDTARRWMQMVDAVLVGADNGNTRLRKYLADE